MLLFSSSFCPGRFYWDIEFKCVFAAAYGRLIYMRTNEYSFQPIKRQDSFQSIISIEFFRKNWNCRADKEHTVRFLQTKFLDLFTARRSCMKILSSVMCISVHSQEHPKQSWEIISKCNKVRKYVPRFNMDVYEKILLLVFQWPGKTINFTTYMVLYCHFY